MKTLKEFQARQIVRLLQFGGLAVALIVTMSQTSQAQLVPADQVIITDDLPEILFRDNSAGADFNWEVEGLAEQFEIAEEGANPGDGIFKIFPNAREDALTLRGSSVIIGDRNRTGASTICQLMAESNASMELLPNSGATSQATISANSFHRQLDNFRQGDRQRPVPSLNNL